MNIIILINTKKYKYHKYFIDDLINGINLEIPNSSVKTINMHGSLYLHEIFEVITAFNPHLLINLDYVGFDLLTESGTLSLNQIPMQCANVQLKRRNSYYNELNYRQNFSMWTYIPVEEDIEKYISEYPHITNFAYFCEVVLDQPSQEQREFNIQSIKSWIPTMLNDLWLQ